MERKEKLHIIGKYILDYVNPSDIDSLEDCDLDSIIEELELHGKLRNDFDQEALLIAEKFGIIEYNQENGIMTWLEKLPTEGTYLHRVCLRTMHFTVDQINTIK